MSVQGFISQGALTPDNLFAGEFPRVSEVGIITGGDYAKGTILGKITASGKYAACAPATDGSEIPCAILGEAADAGSADRQAVVYLTGEFNAAALAAGEGFAVSGLKEALRNRGIFIKTNQGA